MFRIFKYNGSGEDNKSRVRKGGEKVMPWTARESLKHKKGLNPSQQKSWAKIANGVYRDCMKSKGNDKFCSGKAIRIASWQVGHKRKA